MIIGFGFGSPLVSLMMFVLTLLISYSIYHYRRQKRFHSRLPGDEREQRRAYYLEMREQARRVKAFDLTDEEIEQRLDDELVTDSRKLDDELGKR